MKNAIFIVGMPGSGKDILIKNIFENLFIKEYNVEQIFKKKFSEHNLLVKGCAWEPTKILEAKVLLEKHNYNTSLIVVDVSESVSKKRLIGRNISEQSIMNKIYKSRECLDEYIHSFNKYYIFDNSLDICNQENNIKEFEKFTKSIIDPIPYIKEKHLKNVKDYLYKNFMKSKDKNVPESKYSDFPLKPDGYNEYDIRMSGQSNVIHYTNEDIGSPEALSSLTGMSINPPDDMTRLDKFIIEPENKKPKMYKKFNSPPKEEIKNAKLWSRTKEIIFRG